MSDLKLFAKCYVEAHDLSMDNKRNLFEYIDMADDYEVMNLLTTGRITTLTEDQQTNIVENFKQTVAYPIILLGEQVLVKPTASFANFHVPEVVTNFFWYLSKKITGKSPYATRKAMEMWLSKADVNQVTTMFTKLVHGAGDIGVVTLLAVLFFLAAKVLKSKLSVCRKLPKYKRAECIKKLKADAIKSQIDVLRNGITTCKHTTKPDKCRKTIQKRIDKLQKKLQKVQ